jgi:U3 small nucleolar RNA-associated protein 11
MLEKKKDYKKRANAHHERREELTKLRTAAEERNVDEFDFGMIRSKVNENAVVVRESLEKFSKKELAIMASQDVGYVRMRAAQERKRIQQLRDSLASLQLIAENLSDASDEDDEDEDDGFGIGGGARGRASRGPRHTVFVDSADAMDSALKQRRREVDPTRARRVSRSTKKLYADLAARTERLVQINEMLRKLEVERHASVKVDVDSEGEDIGPPEEDRRAKKLGWAAPRQR